MNGYLSTTSFVPNAMRSLFTLVGLFLCINVHAQSTQQVWQLLIPNAYHSYEAPAEPGTGWLALVPVGSGWSLESAVVRSTRVIDPVMDEEGGKTGIKITSNRDEAIALIRLPGIKAGRVDTPNMKFRAKPRLISSGDSPLKVLLNHDEYVIQPAGAQIQLRIGKDETILADLAAREGDDSDSASLIWAGDLDRDGKLDLLFSYERYNAFGSCLYLSSIAGEGEVVRQAACHGGVGC